MCAYIHTLYAYVYRIYIQITYALQLYACVYRIYIQIINACVCIYLHLYVYMYAEYICKLYKHMYRGTHYMCIFIQNITYLNVNRNENTFSATSTGFYTRIFIQNIVYVYDTIRIYYAPTALRFGQKRVEKREYLFHDFNRSKCSPPPPPPPLQEYCYSQPPHLPHPAASAGAAQPPYAPSLLRYHCMVGSHPPPLT